MTGHKSNSNNGNIAAILIGLKQVRQFNWHLNKLGYKNYLFKWNFITIPRLLPVSEFHYCQDCLKTVVHLTCSTSQFMHTSSCLPLFCCGLLLVSTCWCSLCSRLSFISLSLVSLLSRSTRASSRQLPLSARLPPRRPSLPFRGSGSSANGIHFCFFSVNFHKLKILSIILPKHSVTVISTLLFNTWIYMET